LTVTSPIDAALKNGDRVTGCFDTVKSGKLHSAVQEIPPALKMAGYAIVLSQPVNQSINQSINQLFG
jgi:hypothetical protein